MSYEKPKNLEEICGNCGLRLGSHSASEYYSEFYKQEIPYNCCPGHAGQMDWDKGPGTIFLPTGRFEDAKEDDDEEPEIHGDNYGDRI